MEINPWDCKPMCVIEGLPGGRYGISIRARPFQPFGWNLKTPAPSARPLVTPQTLPFMFEQAYKNTGNAGRNGGEYYTPRPLIRAT
jgi:hypothetical protein